MNFSGLKSREKKFGKVGVLAGGPSNERAISLRSGKAVYDAIIREGIDAIFLDVKDDICDIIRYNKIDIAFIALHGRFGEDGTVQTILERAGIAYTGSGPRASKLALDKIASKDIFLKNGIPTPRYSTLNMNETPGGKKMTAAADALGFPIVVKPQWEGSSIGLCIARNEQGLKKAVDEAFKYGGSIILEEFIDGRELTVGILDDEPLPVIEIITKNKIYDYSAKYNDPETRYLVPAPVKEEVSRRAQNLARRSHESLGCSSFSRVDMMLDRSGDIFVLEVNTIPGMTERSLLPKAAKATGLNFGQLCIKLLENALKT